MVVSPSEVNTKPDGMTKEEMIERFDMRLKAPATWLVDKPGQAFAFPDMYEPTASEIKRLGEVLAEYEAKGWDVKVDGRPISQMERVIWTAYTKVRFAPKEESP